MKKKKNLTSTKRINKKIKIPKKGKIPKKTNRTPSPLHPPLQKNKENRKKKH